MVKQLDSLRELENEDKSLEQITYINNEGLVTHFDHKLRFTREELARKPRNGFAKCRKFILGQLLFIMAYFVFYGRIVILIF